MGREAIGDGETSIPAILRGRPTHILLTAPHPSTDLKKEEGNGGEGRGERRTAQLQLK